jgi:hypothetical protein
VEIVYTLLDWGQAARNDVSPHQDDAVTNNTITASRYGLAACSLFHNHVETHAACSRGRAAWNVISWLLEVEGALVHRTSWVKYGIGMEERLRGATEADTERRC